MNLNPFWNRPKLGRKVYFKIFNHLQMSDLSRLSSTCKQVNYFVNEYVQSLQVIFDDSHEAQHVFDLEKNHVFLVDEDPGHFFYPNPPFHKVTKLYILSLNHSGENSKINLIAFPMLQSLKIRGPLIKLSSNRLVSVTDVDIEDVDCCERQVFLNMKNFSIEFDLEEMSQIYNSTEYKALEFIFIKAGDILAGKKKIENVKITLSMYLGDMESILVFEKFVDSLETFLSNYDELCGEGKINVLLKYNEDYLKVCSEDAIRIITKKTWSTKTNKDRMGLERRFEDGFRRLNYILQNRHYNFKIDYKLL